MPVTLEVFGLPPCRQVQPPGPGGWPRGAGTKLASTTRAPAWLALGSACGNQEVDARRSVDEQARSGGYWAEAMHGSHLKAGDVTGASRPRAKSVPGAPGTEPQVWGVISKPDFRRVRICCDNPVPRVTAGAPRTSPPPSGLAVPKSASAHPLTHPKRPCGGRTGRRVGARCSARPDVPAGGVLVGRSRSAVHVGPRGAAPRTAAPSQDALLGVFTFEKALLKNTGGGGGPGRAQPWVG